MCYLALLIILSIFLSAEYCPHFLQCTCLLMYTVQPTHKIHISTACCSGLGGVLVAGQTVLHNRGVLLLPCPNLSDFQFVQQQSGVFVEITLAELGKHGSVWPSTHIVLPKPGSSQHKKFIVIMQITKVWGGFWPLAPKSG